MKCFMKTWRLERLSGTCQRMVTWWSCKQKKSKKMEGQASCLPCTPGKYQDNEGQASCIPCVVNVASADTGRKTPCNMVDEGSIVLGGMTSVKIHMCTGQVHT